MKILVTGATGFVGRALISDLLESKFSVIAAVRSGSGLGSTEVLEFNTNREFEKTDWEEALIGTDIVIHLAALVHVMGEGDNIPSLSAYRSINTEGSLNLARQAAHYGVGRFIFLSSIKTLGEETAIGKPFFADNLCSPEDAYGISKHEAEVGMKEISLETGMDVVVIRSPLVYGPGVGGNFLRMIEFVHKGIPLPFGALTNKRSLVSIGNLVSLIKVCMTHTKAANEIFLISDDHDLSTPELLILLGKAMGIRVFLLPVPKVFLMVTLKLLGKGSISKRLLGSLQVDITKTKSLLNWRPTVSVGKSLDDTIEAWLEKSK